MIWKMYFNLIYNNKIDLPVSIKKKKTVLAKINK